MNNNLKQNWLETKNAGDAFESTYGRAWDSFCFDWVQANRGGSYNRIDDMRKNLTQIPCNVIVRGNNRDCLVR